MFNTEFRELGEFLFKEFDEFKTKEDVVKEVRQCKTFEDLLKLNQKLSNSNWNKYFKESIESSNLYGNWNKIQRFRNIIAHNKIMVREEFEELKVLTESILVDLENAIESLDTLEINDDEQKKITSDFGHAINEEKLFTCDACNNSFPRDKINFINDRFGVHILDFCIDCAPRRSQEIEDYDLPF